MQRRNFVTASLSSLLGWLGLTNKSSATATKPPTPGLPPSVAAAIQHLGRADDEWITQQLQHLRNQRQTVIHYVTESYTIFLNTRWQQFRIVVRPDYLGASAQNNYFLRGEDWQRGCDLADGLRTRETWYRIMTDILAEILQEQLTDGWLRNQPEDVGTATAEA